jgi:hypothetical protein
MWFGGKESKESWNCYHPEDFWNAMCQHLPYTGSMVILPGVITPWTRNPLEEGLFCWNYQIMDEDSF